MRPVNKGHKDTVYDPYNTAKRDLFEAIGPYCSYCERKIELGGAIEHVQPKSKVADKECRWENFLLGCVNCNSTKGDTDINEANINEYAWPDIDDTYHLIKYDPVTYIPAPADNLSNSDHERADKLIKLVGLNKPSPKVGTIKYKEASDLRVEKRKEVASYAKEYKNYFLSIEDAGKPYFFKNLKLLVKEMGLWSIWMHEMEDIPELRTALLDLLPGTRKEFF